MTGLTYTREYRTWTFWLRAMFRFVSRFTFDPMESLAVNMGLIKSRQKTLVWTKKETTDKGRLRRPSHEQPSRYVASPSIELTDYCTRPYEQSVDHDTPAMAQSLFPPAITSLRPRHESDASYREAELPIFENYRRSDDSGRPLIQRPSDVHRSRGSSSHHTGEDRRGSDDAEPIPRASNEYTTTPASPYGEPSVFAGWLGVSPPTLHTRHGYRRTTSDPGNPPDAMVRSEAEDDALGISMPVSNVRQGERDKLMH